jgi:adenine deaminase
LQSLLSVARGDRPADLLLKNGRVVNTLSYEIEECSVAVSDGLIAGLGDYEAREVIDLRGLFSRRLSLTGTFILNPVCSLRRNLHAPWCPAVRGR